MKKWLTYCFLLVFAVYWASNLFLWYPWSFSPTLGMTLMLTVSPLAWAYTVYLSLITYPEENIYQGALKTAFIFLITAIVLDYVFFGIIRNALEELYHPTTIYGYGFLLVLPFLVSWILKRKILSKKREVSRKLQISALVVGLSCLLILVLIITLDLNI